MISSYVKRQLAVFAALSLAAVLVIVFVYAHVPTVLGFGQMTLSAMFSDGAGIYVNSNVTERGVQVGKVTQVDLTPRGVQVTMSIAKNPPVGADARAEIHSVSAVGEQYVDLVSNQAGGPYLQDGALIPISRTTVPEQIGPVLDKATTMLASIPNNGLQTFLDEGYKAFNNLGPDLHTLVTSSQDLINTADQNYGQTAQLIQTIGPLLDTQNVAADSVQGYFAHLANFTGVLAGGDRHFRGALRGIDPAVRRASGFLRDNENNAPVLATNARTLGQVAGVYRPGLEEILAEYPVAVDFLLNDSILSPDRGFRAALAANLVEGCSTGYNAQHMRNYNDLSDRDAEPGTYCKVPHNDPRVMRGARNIPCLEGHVGMRAGTVAECFGQTPDEAAGNDLLRIGPKGPLPSSSTGFIPQKGPFTPPANQRHRDADTSTSDPLSAFGGMGTDDEGGARTWQSLLSGPVGS